MLCSLFPLALFCLPSSLSLSLLSQNDHSNDDGRRLLNARSVPATVPSFTRMNFFFFPQRPFELGIFTLLVSQMGQPRHGGEVKYDVSGDQ